MSQKTIYYKAVRPDGTDFYSGTVDYASLSMTGRKLPKLPGGECCTNGVYHASDVPDETLIGGRWPCRLFAVTGKPVSQDGHKFGFRTLQVVGELEAWQVFGRGGREIAAHIERIRTTTPEQTDLMAAAWSAAVYQSRQNARAAALRAAGSAAGGAVWGAVWGAARNDAVRKVAWYATVALVARDLITPEQFDLLYGPWAAVMETGDTHGTA